ncbi:MULTISPECIES: hypothetical protein [Methylobacterium]|uniref:Uncharacterized protein n=1 Tax=Methylobacterium jeotgali TaxID=381630 RepID=A0ABQ4SZK2_9HYPH|nr:MULTISPECIES: hypothetical protein [Methylobacterium]PIU06920.1 MAG: hypothetical protein COT56_07245 [Methylobacterium sp. CG09_land_8_20_14_0_10_71_15]PIU16132.1 MAG: hypothetical protein COT28_01565 [Methylobacterium sp. CG08_land_8_20_14_0_20_71_15]GBU18034.1 hypothetical protein AwMethylo_22490 [Methylobacterium sp.]GJE08640.1 hypothetical protein AOPFMNJM_3983 [Methylobacterium jeotgali]
MPFQTQVYTTQAPAVAGDFASANPRHSALSVPGGFVAAAAGLTVGLFAWADSSTGTILANTGTGAPTCFVHRELNADFYVQSAEYGMTIPGGKYVGEMFSGGDFFAKNAGAGAVTKGMKAFANNTNGSVSFAAAGATVSGSTETKWYAHTAGAAGELIKISNTVP